MFTAVLTLQWAQPVYVFGEDVDALVALVASNDFTRNFTISGMPTEAVVLLVNGETLGMAESGGKYPASVWVVKGGIAFV